MLAGAFAASADPTLVNIDLDATGSSLEPFWKASVGSGHALLGLRDDWRAQLGAVHRDLGITGVRFHGSFDDDMSVVVPGHRKRDVTAAGTSAHAQKCSFVEHQVCGRRVLGIGSSLLAAPCWQAQGCEVLIRTSTPLPRATGFPRHGCQRR